MIEMAVIQVSTYFGTVTAKPMRLVDIHDVSLIADEEESKISESKSDNTEISEVAPQATPSPQEDSSVVESTATFDKQ